VTRAARAFNRDDLSGKGFDAFGVNCHGRSPFWKHEVPFTLRYLRANGRSGC
jgi:hypothetical protein